MIDIAIIDGYLNVDFVVDTANIKELYYFRSKYNIRVEIESHSAKVINTIEKYKNDMDYRYTIFDISDEYGEYCNSGYLLKSLREIKYMKDIKYILMSLIIDNDKEETQFRKICRELREEKKILIAANTNEKGKISIPAKFEDVIGIGRGAIEFDNKYIYNGNDFIEILGDITPEFIQNKFGHYELFSGTSKATAKVLPLIAEIESFNLSVIREKIKENGLNKSMNKVYVLDHIIKQRVFVNEDHLMRIIREINRFNAYTGNKRGFYFRGENIEINKIIKKNEFDRFIIFIGEKFNRKIDLLKINYFNFMTLYDVYIYFEGSDKYSK